MTLPLARRCLPALPILAALALASSPVLAGPVEPGRHAFERVGPAGAAPAVALQLPESNRVLVLSSDGELSLVTGGGLLHESLGRLPVEGGCARRGVLDAAWDPAAPGLRLFVSYVDETNGTLGIGRLDLDANARSFGFERIFDSRATAACDRTGGGLAFASDGTLLLGVGDQGDAASAGSTASRSGKILRVTVEGLPPMAPLAPNPLNPSSPTFAIGVRDPLAIATDPATEESWFLDRGPSDGADELNLVTPLTNHGWGGTELSGHLELPGDPHHVWAPPIGVSGLLVARGGLLGDSLAGGLLVSSTGTGALSSVTPDPDDTLGSLEQPLLTAGPLDPQALASPGAFADGSVQLLGDGEQLWRFRLRQGPSREPSARASAVPSILRKDGLGGFVLAAERLATGSAYGLHVGALDSLVSGYGHPDAPGSVLGPSPEDGEALTSWSLSAEDLGGAGQSSYLLLGAFDGCGGSGLGIDGAGNPRPGGLGDGTVDGGVALLGGGTHALSGVLWTEILSRADGLSIPRDLEFHPDLPGQLWIVNRQDDSTVIVDETGRPTQTSRYVWTSSGNHFLAQPSALAFGPGTRYFATAHEEDDFTQGSATPIDFMGPTLWTNEAVIYDGGHASHYDMLHNSPNGAGIAWESGTAYWIFDGWHESLTRYDFREDHGLGGSDHTDGIIERHAEGLVSYLPDVPSHLVWDHDTDELLVADSGNNRIAVYDPSGATPAGPIGPNYDGCTMRAMAGGSLSTLIEGAEHGLVAPSGLELHDCKLFVTDNATSRIFAFSRDGVLLDWLDTELPAGSLMGIALDPRDGDLYAVDAVGDRVFRLSPL